MTIEVGLWVIPLIVALIGIAHCLIRESGGAYDWTGIVVFGGWVILDLVLWLAWALIR